MAMSPACCAAPVERVRDPETPPCDAPDPRVTAPLEPVAPAFEDAMLTLPLAPPSAVPLPDCSRICPLDDAVLLSPDDRDTEPPVLLDDEPAARRISPPLRAPKPTSTTISPPAPIESPDVMANEPDDPALLLPVPSWMAPLTPLTPDDGVLICTEPLDSVSLLPLAIER